MIKLVGIVGGIGCGKSVVATKFSELGAEVLNGDQLGHEVLAQPEVIELLRARWGDQVLQAGEPPSIDRRAVAKIVFGQQPQAAEELRFLEEVTHRRIGKLIQARLAQLEMEKATQTERIVAMLDAPLLLEAGWDEQCHGLIFIDVPRDIQLRRLAARNWSDTDLAAREARQLPIAEKRARADWIIDNSGTPEDLDNQIRAIWSILTLPKSPS